MIEGSKRHWSRKELAQSLRAQGLSYREIIKQVHVSKSTVSSWCRFVKLSSAQKKILQERRGDQMKGIKAAHTGFWRKRCEAFESGRHLMNRLISDAFFTAGLMLYWAEGNKHRHTAIANSDAEIIRVMKMWFEKYFGIANDAFSLHLHLHSGQNEAVEKQFWSQITGLTMARFIKSYFKPEGSGYKKNILYHGTVKLTVKMKGSTYLLFKILGCIAEYQKIVLDIPSRPEDWMERSQYAEGG